MKDRDRSRQLKPDDVVVLVARCQKNAQSAKTFGIRMQRFEHAWLATWAFAIRSDVAEREGYGKRRITGTFGFDEEYPGCPYCEQGSLCRCSCGVTSCSEANAKSMVCPGCKQRGELNSTVSELDVGGDG
jgi:hypothetical protein